MDFLSILIEAIFQIVVGGIVTFFGLMISCLVAFEEVQHFRLFVSALVVQAIEFVPVLISVTGVVVPIWSHILSSVIAFTMLVPILSEWAGLGAAKSIYVAVLTFMLVSVFSMLVSASA